MIDPIAQNTLNLLKLVEQPKWVDPFRLGKPIEKTMPELDHIDTPKLPTPQEQVDREYVAFIQSRHQRLTGAIGEALYWLSLGERERARNVLNQALTA